MFLKHVARSDDEFSIGYGKQHDGLTSSQIELNPN